MEISPLLPLRAHFRVPFGNGLLQPHNNGSASKKVTYSSLDPPTIRTLPNGLKVVLQKVPVFNSCALNVTVNTGSVDEDSCVNGISHFIEHIVFKGTKTRTALQISEGAEELGADLNAFTSEELTAFHAVGLGEFSPLLLELLLDIVFNPRLDENDIEMEKGPIIQEIKMYKDNPQQRTIFLLSELMFKDHPYGRPILGSIDTVSSLNKDKLQERLNKLYVPQNIVLSVSGNFDEDDITKLVESLSPISKYSFEKSQVAPYTVSSDIVIENKDTEQAHFALGTYGPSIYEEDKYVLRLLNIALGGGMSSRLFQEIREKRGLAYSVYSFDDINRQCGIFGVYVGCDLDKVTESLSLILKEFEDIKKNGLTPKELNKAKMQLKSQLLLQLESTSSVAFSNARNQLYFNRDVSGGEITNILNAIDNDRIIKLANKIFNPKLYSLAVVGPEAKLPKASSFNLAA